MNKQQKKLVIIGILILTLIIIDQISKIIIPKEYKVVIAENILNFNFIKNTGAAFGIGSDNVLSFIIISGIVIILIGRFLITQIDRIDKLNQVALAIILAGGTSNLLDRLIRGYVVDFIDFNPIIKFPIFNLADIYIVIGWIVFVLKTIINCFKKEKKGT